MGQAAQLVAASDELRGASSRYVGAAAELETMVGTMSGVVHGLITHWKGLGSDGFATAWKAAARDAFRTIEALGSTGGAMIQLANTIDENFQAINGAETLAQEVPHGINIGQRLSIAETQSSLALSAIQSKASSLAGQLHSVVVPLTTGGCSTGSEPLPPGGFDGVTTQPQPVGPNGPGGLPPGLVGLMDGGGEGGGSGGVGIMHLLASLGIAGYQTWPDFQKDGYLSPNAWEHFMINFTTAYAVGPEGSVGKLAGFTSIEALLQTMPEIQQEVKDKKFDPTTILYMLGYHTAVNMTLEKGGDLLQPFLGDAGTIGATGLTDAQLEKLAGDPEKLKETLDKILAQMPSLPPNDTSVPQPSPGPSPVPPGSTPSPSPLYRPSPTPNPTPSPTP